MSYLDGSDKEIAQQTETFKKKFSLMPIVGIMPYKLIKNTQLQSGETRNVTFALPLKVKAMGKKARVQLQFYEVADEFQWDIKKAHWQGEVIRQQAIILKKGE